MTADPAADPDAGPDHQRPLKRHVVLTGARVTAGGAVGHSATIAAAIAVASSSVGCGRTLC